MKQKLAEAAELVMEYGVLKRLWADEMVKKLAKIFSLLVILALCLGAGPRLTLPLVAPPGNKTVYISVSAYNSSFIESDMATPLAYLYPSTQRVVTVAWDPSPSSNVVGYVFYSGTNMGMYPNRVDVGRSFQFTLVLIPPVTNYYAAFGQKTTNLATWTDIGIVSRWTNVDGSGLGPPREYYRLRVQQGTNAIP